jgi:hypothetical protein
MMISFSRFNQIINNHLNIFPTQSYTGFKKQSLILFISLTKICFIRGFYGNSCKLIQKMLKDLSQFYLKRLFFPI